MTPQQAPQLRMEQSLGEGSTIEQKMVPGQWYAIQMDFALKQMRREMKEMRLEESARDLRQLNQMDEGCRHYLHTIVG